MSNSAPGRRMERRHILDLKRAHIHGADRFATNEPRFEDIAGTATAEEIRLAALFEGPGAPDLQRALDQRRGSER